VEADHAGFAMTMHGSGGMEPGAVTRRRIAEDEARVRREYARREEADPYGAPAAGDLFILEERERAVLRLLERSGLLPLDAHAILDVGCGRGTWIRDLLRWGGRADRIGGAELRPESAAWARRTLPPDVAVCCSSAAALPFPGSSFDVVLQSMMFSSVLDPLVRRMIAVEMMRVLRPGGTIVWYDLRINNPRNSQVRAVTQREVEALFSGMSVRLRSTTLAAPLARLVAPRSVRVCRTLGRMPFLHSHYLGTISASHPTSAPQPIQLEEAS
jgi:SAM-dependent methyltransferase